MKKIHLDGEVLEYEVLEQTSQRLVIGVGEESFSFIRRGSREFWYEEGGELVRPNLWQDPQGVTCLQWGSYLLRAQRPSRGASSGVDGGGEVKSPMPGKVFKILVQVGEKVAPGTPLIVVEAMKMEHTLKAAGEGVVQQIKVGEGEQVQSGQVLVLVHEGEA